jgi:DinB superfamily
MTEQAIRQQLSNMLTVVQAHMSFEDAVKGFPEEHINTKPENVTYSFWHLIEHLRITQWDILDYIRNPNYRAAEFPKEYWPDPNATTDIAGWNRTITQFNADLAALVAIINDPKTDLYAQIPHGAEGHNILREMLIIGEHNAYHTGELGILRGVMGLW